MKVRDLIKPNGSNMLVEQIKSDPKNFKPNQIY